MAIASQRNRSVSGHDFSRAVKRRKRKWASAPASVLKLHGPQPCRNANQKHKCHPERSAATNFSREKCVFPARSRMDLRLLLLNREGRSLSTGSKWKRSPSRTDQLLYQGTTSVVPQSSQRKRALAPAETPSRSPLAYASKHTTTAPPEPAQHFDDLATGYGATSRFCQAFPARYRSVNPHSKPLPSHNHQRILA